VVVEQVVIDAVEAGHIFEMVQSPAVCVVQLEVVEELKLEVVPVLVGALVGVLIGVFVRVLVVSFGSFGSSLSLSGSSESLYPVFPPLSLAGGQVCINKSTHGKWKSGNLGSENQTFVRFGMDQRMMKIPSSSSLLSLLSSHVSWHMQPPG
jgi:hypothetical protein